MANKRLTELSSATVVDTTDVIYIVKSGVSYQITALNLIRDGIADLAFTTGSAAPYYGIVNPESGVAAAPGSTYLNTANQTFWAKQATTTNTGWLQLI